MHAMDSTANRRLPSRPWAWTLGGALLMLLATVTCMEVPLARLGFHPGLADSPSMWARQRARVDTLGSRALVLVGNSRMQNDTDVDTLRRETGLEPVQLATGGSSFLPVLEGLAADPGVTGTVLVNFEAGDLARPPQDDMAASYEREYEREPHSALPDFDSSEAWLSDQLHLRLRSYADGARPLTTLRTRILPGKPSQQYSTLLPDREVLIDFHMLSMPHYALFRAARELDEFYDYSPLMNDARLRAAIERHIAEIQPDDDALFLKNVRAVAAMVAAIQAHGGRVIFVMYPRSGLIQQIGDKRFPRGLFWDKFAAAMPGALNFEDVPALRAFPCPDGSHIDYRDRPRFTSELVAALHLGKGALPN